MDIKAHIFALLETIIFILIILIAFIYSIPIICVRRFHQPNNILTLNVCVGTILCCLSWLPIYAADMFGNPYEFLKKISLYFTTAQILFTIQVPFSFVVASLHRYCFLVYHTKIFFKRKTWIILCIGSQWVLGFVIAIPNLICVFTVCEVSVWPSVYVFGGAVMLPSIMCFITNVLVYNHVRSSSRRIQPQTVSVNIQQTKISHRDIVLLRHMVLMFCIFVGGWTPIFIFPIINYYTPVNKILVSTFTIWCELALLFDMIDLFLYNHELRKYLKDICLQCFRL